MDELKEKKNQLMGRAGVEPAQNCSGDKRLNRSAIFPFKLKEIDVEDKSRAINGC